MKIEAVRYAGGTLILQTNDPEAKQFVYRFKAGKYDIVPHKEKRSKDANGLMWALCGEISDAVGIPSVEVYRNAIREIGVYKDFEWTVNEAKTLRTAWSRLGIGWVTEQLDFTPDGETLVVRCWYGSSTYNTKQMSRLIDNLIQDAEALGLPTPDSERIESLLKEWDAQKN